MTDDIASARAATDLLLRAMFWGPQPEAGITGPTGFQVIHPHEGTSFYYGASALLDAVLFIRQHASPHLRSLSVEDLQAMLLAFVDKEFGAFRFATWQIPQDKPFIEHLAPDEIDRLADAMRQSPIFVTPSMLFLFPLSIVKIAAPFKATSFFLLPPSNLGAELADWYDVDELQPYHQPPVPMQSAPRSVDVSCWLGIRATGSSEAMGTRNAIVGALGLLPHPLERYLFSMRTVPRGYTSLERWATYHSADPSSPPLSEDLIISAEDHGWLNVLGGKLVSDVAEDRRAVLALQYFFRAWVRDPANRVAPLCGAIEALRSGDVEGSNRRFADAMAPLGPTYNKRRIGELLSLRGAVIHGGAPNVYEVSSYQSYWTAYRCDPVRDLELVAARFLQREIFAGAIAEREHTYADLLRRHGAAI